MCILNQLKHDELYGYEIMKTIKDQFNDVYDGSIYAILRRLNADGYTETYTKNSPSGPARKYYRMTPTGSDYLDKMIVEWQKTIERVGKLGIPFR